ELDEVPAAEPAEAAEPENEWNQAMAFSTTHTQAAPRPRRQSSPKEKAKTRLMLILGACLHLTAITILILWLSGAFRSSQDSTPPPEKEQKARAPIRGPRDQPQK
ncbi:MAG TPA: hypothetical protein VKE74_35430, partial [Gemmataceae bacterium]|nr:hypothetical protein [Gemmataceae bacterium]